MWAIVEEYYLLKQEQGGEGGLGKRRHDDDQEDFVDVKRQRFVDPDDGRDRYDKAERYNQGELERVQRIPKKEEEGGDEAKVKVEAPSAEKIREMMAATQKAIEDRKKKLKLVPVPPSQGAALGAKAQQLAALQASIASKLSQVVELNILTVTLINTSSPLFRLSSSYNMFTIRCCPQSYLTSQCH